MNIQPTTTTLPADLGRFFQTDLSNVALHLHPFPRLVGAKALAHGNHIHLDPAFCDWNNPSHRALLAHEVTHVLQQRQGRARAAAGITRDWRLEEEADRVGACYAAGLPCPVDFTDTPKTGGRAVQAQVFINNERLQNTGLLETNVQQILGLIENGLSWLSWAINDPTARYNFPTQALLLEGVQLGLHGAPMLLLRKTGALVSPMKLATIPAEQFAPISLYESGGSTSPQARTDALSALANYRIFTATDFQTGLDYLGNTLEVEQNPIFQNMTIPGLIAISELPKVTTNADIAQRAATIAIDEGRAQSALEFCDWYNFAVAYYSTNQQQNITTTMEEMERMLNGAMRAAVSSIPLEPAPLLSFLQQWAMAGHQLGFPRLSRAVWQTWRYLNTKGLPIDQAHVHAYLNKARGFFIGQAMNPGAMEQDGSTVFYGLDNGEDTGLLLWRGGSITISAFYPSNVSASNDEDDSDPTPDARTGTGVTVDADDVQAPPSNTNKTRKKS